MEVVLIEPEIPQNTGNIARTCVGVGARLTLVEPIGFSLSQRQLRRAGLDYWDHLDLQVCDQLQLKPPFYLFTTKAEKSFWEVDYSPDVQLIFGPESRGLPNTLLEKWPEQCVKIPQSSDIRSLNLSNAVAIALYEAIRTQCNF